MTHFHDISGNPRYPLQSRRPPGTVLAIEEPYISQGNRSAIVRLFFGEAERRNETEQIQWFQRFDGMFPSRCPENMGVHINHLLGSVPSTLNPLDRPFLLRQRCK